MSTADPKVLNIPAGVAFADALAEGVIQRWGHDPLTLAKVRILLPNRRACRVLQEAFLRISQARALLLPRLMPLGDLDADELELTSGDVTVDASAETEIPPAIPPLRRQLLLARLIMKWGEVAAADDGIDAPSEDQAVRLAAELASLLDQVETEGLDLRDLKNLVPQEYASHWQITLDFLEILSAQWPAIQAEAGCVGIAERRRLLLEAQAAAWQEIPPDFPIVVAGSTGSIPATAALIKVISSLPQGYVVLPGADLKAGERAWQAIGTDPSHPQYGLHHLLARLETDRNDVGAWSTREESAAAQERAGLLATALLPADVTPEWLDAIESMPSEDIAAALEPLQRIDCPGASEEAMVIALLMRESLEEDGRRAALVTPDRALARRVATELGRWGLTVDDSAGQPLATSLAGSFLRLTAEMIAGKLEPLATLAALKHPMASGGLSRERYLDRLRQMEKLVWRGVRPAPGFSGLLASLDEVSGNPKQDEQKADCRRFVEWLAQTAADFDQTLEAAENLENIIDAHIAFMEALAASDSESGAERIWLGEAGAALANFVDELRDAANSLPYVSRWRYPALLSSLLEGRVVRQSFSSHPRLSILGPLEARLLHPDVMILGGLNEGTWPMEVDSGPWLSRPMRADFNLPSPERRIGLSAHDFAQAASAPRVYITRATRVDGTPTVPSRWLLRLDALLQGLGISEALTSEAPDWLAWAEMLDKPDRTSRGKPPAPRPPLAARPRRLSVTRIETWRRDPYALYAREILRLRPLDPIDADPGGAEKGTIIHEILELFLQAYPDRWPADPEGKLLEIGAEVFERAAVRPGLRAFWWPRFLRIAEWFAGAEEAWREQTRRSYPEETGRLVLSAPGGAFELTAKADRIDALRDGGFAILDYKTGRIPTDPEVEMGYAPQLPLEAAMFNAGAFGDLRGEVTHLSYWRLTGGTTAGEMKPLKQSAADSAEAAITGLTSLITRFDNPETPYPAQPRHDRRLRFNDYAHLARIKEWTAGEGGSD
ncbi:double-strand break repair protein AddB [Denitrobaculum tricleocarpae]|uniref:Double-strand break repair protein AddB n=1 Tax=Denitrobaculum tricleocarpae TaxID=2591009 RepID=A0A545TG37_9PROT|nr:double-strand break repair protein AddB [Denitrobaculum tricleocarpae]TQV76192.1 double-strand break repair protein AddB [Denitrobaculum tricleocarpae]